MKLRVRNFVGVKSADLELAQITLVGGTNNQGKSSLCEAVLACALADPDARGMSKKKDHEHLVHDGAELASSTLSGEGWQVRIVWPEGKVEATGVPQAFGTPLGMGAVRFASLDARARARELTDRLNLLPGLPDLEAFLGERDPSFVTRGKEKDAKSFADQVWERIELSGWDPVLTAAKEGGTKLKGAWENITGLKWGSTRAASWVPTTLLSDEIYDLAEMEAGAKKALAALEALLRKGSPVDPEVLKRAKKLALGKADAEESLGAAVKEISRLDAEVERLEKVYRDTPEPVEDQPVQHCPHCAKAVHITRGDRGGFFVSAAPTPTPGSKLKDMRIARQAAEQAWDQAKRALQAAHHARMEALTKLESAKSNAELVKQLQSADPAPDEEVVAARAVYDAAKRQADDVRKMQEARAIYAKWLRNTHFIDALSPEGVRAKKAREGLTAFNEKSAEIAGVASYAAVQVTEDFELEWGGRPYALLSESEKWRADLLLTLALAKLEKPALIVVDRFDVLVPALRKGALQALKSVGIPCLLVGTMDAPEKMPNLAKVGYGSTWWMEDGTLRPAHAA